MNLRISSIEPVRAARIKPFVFPTVPDDLLTFDQLKQALDKTEIIFNTDEHAASITRDGTLDPRFHLGLNGFKALTPGFKKTVNAYSAFVNYRNDILDFYKEALKLVDSLRLVATDKTTDVRNELCERLGNLIDLVNAAYAARSMLEQYKNAPYYDKAYDAEYQKQHDYISGVIAKAEDARNYLNGLKF